MAEEPQVPQMMVALTVEECNLILYALDHLATDALSQTTLGERDMWRRLRMKIGGRVDDGTRS